MTDHHKLYLFFAFVLILFPQPVVAASPPAIPLANSYQSDHAIEKYWVSEKLDGVRAYWDGQQLLSKRGNIYHAPKWFTAGFPPFPLDGELWIARGQFEPLLSTVRKLQPVDSEWRRVRYMLFDLPRPDTPFGERLMALQQILKDKPSPYLQMIPQQRIGDQQVLDQLLDEVIAKGGEGLMLHHQDSLYLTGRSDKLLKLKRYQDAEARVIQHLPGKGKYLGMMGSLLVEDDQGQQFRIGSGFSDKERQNPPPLGSIITFKFHGRTDRGIPRFASFLRIRETL